MNSNEKRCLKCVSTFHYVAFTFDVYLQQIAMVFEAYYIALLYAWSSLITALSVHSPWMIKTIRNRVRLSYTFLQFTQRIERSRVVTPCRINGLFFMLMCSYAYPLVTIWIGWDKVLYHLGDSCPIRKFGLCVFSWIDAFCNSFSPVSTVSYYNLLSWCVLCVPERSRQNFDGRLPKSKRCPELRICGIKLYSVNFLWDKYQQNPLYFCNKTELKQVIVGTNFTDLGKSRSLIILLVQGFGTRQTWLKWHIL